MKLNEVVPWGRTLEEYRLMFDLSDRDLNKKILGCGDGPASFNAEMTESGRSVISIDPIYQFSAEEIRRRVQKTYDVVISQTRQHAHRFIWKTFRDVDALGQARLAAMEMFLQDYAIGQAAGRYLAQSLPDLNLSEDHFDLCVCSHLLFLYSQQLSFDFHIASIQELLRVSSEVRIFPLLNLDGERSPYVEPIVQDLVSKGFNAQIQTVPYEFQKGGNQMLQIRKQAP